MLIRQKLIESNSFGTFSMAGCHSSKEVYRLLICVKLALPFKTP